MTEVEVLWANHNELLIANGVKRATVKRKWFEVQLRAGKCKVNSLQVLCIDKLRDKNNNIVSYLLKDNAGNTCEVTPEKLKHAIMYYQVDCVNLTLTSDNRLIDKAVNNIEESNTNEKTKIARDIIASAIQMKRIDPKAKISDIIAYIKELEKKSNVSIHDEVQNRIYRIVTNKNEMARLQKIVVLIGNQDYMSDDYIPALTQKQFNYYMKASILYEALLVDKVVSTNTTRVMYNENKAYIDEYDFTKNQYAVDENAITNALNGSYNDWFYKVCRGEHKVIVFGDILNRLDYALL